MTKKYDSKYDLLLDLNDKLEDIVDFLMPVRTLMVFLASVFTVVLSMLIAFYLRHNFSFHTKEVEYLPQILFLAIFVKMTMFLVFRLYGGMWRYVSITDMVMIFSANFVSSAMLMGIVHFYRSDYFPGFSLSVLVIDFLVCFLIMSGKRVVTRVIRESASRAAGVQNVRTLVVGNAEDVNGLVQALYTAPGSRKIIGVLCEDVKIGTSLRGLPVLGKPDSAAKCAKKHKASEILLLPPYSGPSSLRGIMDELEERDAKCELRMIPAYSDIADGSISVSNIKEVEIEDLLGRKPVKLDRTDVAQFVSSKSIMVTGAGGSIGSELCRQIAAYKPQKLVLFELSEFNLYEINRKLRKEYPELAIVNIVGDVRSRDDVMGALSKNSVNVVYHAAAYKHVPLMEENPQMAFKTNVVGTAELASCCERAGVSRMVMISSDKAVRPTSVMGSTKRIAERIILEREPSGTEFVVVRFGNVLDSSGSVIPLFKQQIKEGGPITVTSQNVVRYFMSIPEAVDLVLQAAAIGKDRDVMVLEMGQQVRIYDMAKKLIELSGFIPGKDIEIKITGLRPGEKEYEELLTDEEKVDRTPYDRIYVLRKDKEDIPETKVDESKIRRLIEDGDIPGLKASIFEYIPENKFHERPDK